MGRILAALLVVVALTGCSTTTVPEAGLDDKQLAAIRNMFDDANWANTGLSDDLRPPHPVVTTVSGEDWADAYVKCMNIAGFDQYVAGADGSFTITGVENLNARPVDEAPANYICNASFEVDGNYDGYFNPAQMDYLFDYFQQVLVPCLEVRGYSVVQAPSREKYIEVWGGWHPYFSVEASEQRDLFDDDGVLEACPPTPAGMPDPGYAGMWEQ